MAEMRGAVVMPPPDVAPTRPRKKAAARPYRRSVVSLRTDPRPITCATNFVVPDRLFVGPISFNAQVVAVGLCRLARNGEVAIAPDNKAIARAVGGASNRSVDTSLAEIENAGFIFRVSRATGTQASDMAKLAGLGYSCPWAARDEDLPLRVIVLLWRLPESAALAYRDASMRR